MRCRLRVAQRGQIPPTDPLEFAELLLRRSLHGNRETRACHLALPTSEGKRPPLDCSVLVVCMSSGVSSPDIIDCRLDVRSPQTHAAREQDRKAP